MSFREKTAWICLISTVAVYLPYFGHVYRLFARGELYVGTSLVAFIGAVVAQVVLAAAGAIAVTIGSNRERRDERDAAIDLKAYHFAYVILITACGLAAGGIFARALTHAPSARGLEPVAIAQLLLLCFVVAEAARYLTQAVSYRRGV